MFLSTLDYNFLFRNLKLFLSTTTRFTLYVQNVHSWEFLDQIVVTYDMMLYIYAQLGYKFVLTYLPTVMKCNLPACVLADNEHFQRHYGHASIWHDFVKVAVN